MKPASDHPHPALPPDDEAIARIPAQGGPPLASLGDDGIVYLGWPHGVRVTAIEAREGVAAVEAVCAGGRRPLLVEMAATSVSREARSIFAQPGSPSRVAILGSSPVDKVIANVVMAVSGLPVPTKFFTVRSEAVTWLRNVPHDAGR